MQNWPCEAWLKEDGLVSRVWKNGQLLLATGGQQQVILLSKLLLLQPPTSFSLAHPLQSPPSLGTHISAPCSTYCIFHLCVQLDLSLSVGAFLWPQSVAPSSTRGFMCIFKIHKFFLYVYIYLYNVLNSLVVKVMSPGLVAIYLHICTHLASNTERSR